MLNLVCHLSKLILFVKKKSPQASFFSDEANALIPSYKMCALFSRWWGKLSVESARQQREDRHQERISEHQRSRHLRIAY